MAGLVCRLKHGADVLDLNDGISYIVAEGFTPPPVQLTGDFAAGTAANAFGGGRLSGVTATDRNLSFELILLGTTQAAIDAAARRVSNFLNRAWKTPFKDTPLYLQLRGHNDYPYEPVWGQTGAYLNYEILLGSCSLPPDWGGSGRYSGLLESALVSLQIKPLALGLDQVACQATGGVIEDIFGAMDGESRGVMVPENKTNLFSNPIFGHATWNNGWTTGGGMSSNQNTDPEFILVGSSSARLVAGAAADKTFYQTLTLTVATYAIVFYAKKRNSGVVDSTDLKAVYNSSAQTTTFTYVGKGWYRGVSFVTGVASPLGAGVVGLTIGYEIFVDGFQCIAGGYEPLIIGDMLGCAWTGTAHASTSTRTEAKLRLPTANLPISMGQGSIRIGVQFDNDYTYSVDQFLFSLGGSALRAYYQASDDKFYLTDGTNTISSSAQNYPAGTKFLLHFIWGPGTLKIYINGAPDGSGGTYTPPALGAAIYLGESSTPDKHLLGRLKGFTIFDRTMSATEIAADNTNLAPILALDGMIDAIPWHYTRDGDDVYDNADDATYQNWGVVSGVPGSAPAETTIDIVVPNISPTALWLLQTPLHALPFLKPNQQWYGDENTTVSAGTDSGGKITNTASFTGLGPGNEASKIPENMSLLPKMNTHQFARLSDAGTGLLGYPAFLAGAGVFVYGDKINLVADATRRLFYIGDLNIDYFEFDLLGIGNYGYIGFLLALGRTGSTAVVTIDYFSAIPGYMLYLKGTIATGFNVLTLRIRGNKAINFVTSTGFTVKSPLVDGDQIELIPGVYNLLTLLIGESGAANTIADYATITLKVRPRYELI